MCFSRSLEIDYHVYIYIVIPILLYSLVRSYHLVHFTAYSYQKAMSQHGYFYQLMIFNIINISFNPYFQL